MKETFINTPSYKFTMPPSKMWPLCNILAACIHGYEFHALSTIEGKALVWSCVQREASPVNWPAEHPPQNRWVPRSLSSSRSDEHLTSSTCYLQTGNDFAVDHEAVGKMLFTRTSSRLIWYKWMLQCSTKTFIAGGTRWLSWAQHLHSLRFNNRGEKKK